MTAMCAYSTSAIIGDDNDDDMTKRLWTSSYQDWSIIHQCVADKVEIHNVHVTCFNLFMYRKSTSWRVPLYPQEFFIKKLKHARNLGTCVLKEYMVNCQSILSITVSWSALDQRFINTPSTPQLTLAWHLGQQSVKSQLTFHQCILVSQQSANYWPTFNWVSAKNQLGLLSVDWGYQSILDGRCLLHTWSRI